MTTTTLSDLRHEAIKPKIGTRILNSKEELLSGALGGAVRALLEQRGVIVLPKIGFTDDEQIAFTRTLGLYAPEGEGGGPTKITLDARENPAAAPTPGNSPHVPPAAAHAAPPIPGPPPAWPSY